MLEQMLNRIGEIQERASVKTVFGEPYHINGRTIVPVGKVTFGFGFGGGRGTAKEDQGPGLADGGAGGGVGGGMSVRPVAVLEMSKDTTTVRPIVDVTRLAVAGMLLVAWNIFWISYTVRRTAGRRAAEQD